MNMTPPQRTSPLPQSTPIHTQSSTTDGYDSEYEWQHDTFHQLSNEIHPFFVGPMPPRDFLDEFLCLPSQVLGSLPRFKEGMFSALSEPSGSRESGMYDKFVWFKSHPLS